MVWTSSRPTILGWYWWRLHRFGEKAEEKVVEVIAVWKGGKITVSQLIDDDVYDDTTEWSSVAIPYPTSLKSGG